ncbi:ornithine cyclodeaminase [Hasllibacter halocynthiae]|uniref:Ornithine cyclodeaminase n=1 Tax=Hasllibacter halocynthiae TaxID=595589 RepID=A0A2T0X369_9RHOB|nr:NAD(P)-binding domain-containing protein [Hasllibacter halocynthiae]PRY93357.1 ornithine cyclodeaminase [Hasllibacter halocynthiae]
MSRPPHLGEDVAGRLDWLALTDALAEGHRGPRAQVSDAVVRAGGKTLLNRAAWAPGVGALVKTATVVPDADPSVNGAVTLFRDADGGIEATIDFHLLTKWKTAGDSLLGARRLARRGSADVLIVGAGAVGHSLREAYGALFPRAAFRIWNRTPEKAEALAARFDRTAVAPDLEAAVRAADVVTVATMSTEPVVRGAWLRPGTHLDLIGAYRADMREADDDALQAGRLFVDSRDTTLAHIGELTDPLARGAIGEADVVADFWDMDRMTRTSEDEITVFKNGGGAHLDLMAARWMLSHA